MRRRAFWFIVAAVVISMGYVVYRMIALVDHAERALHAVHIMASVMEDYVTLHEGQWPNSWEDLETTPAREWGMYSWPRDSSILQQYVKIDFQVDTSDVARRSAGEFKAITPLPPCYEGYHDYFESLLKAIREFQQSKGGHAE